MENEVNMKCNLVWSVTGRDWFVMSVKEGLVSVPRKGISKYDDIVIFSIPLLFSRLIKQDWLQLNWISPISGKDQRKQRRRENDQEFGWNSLLGQF